DVGVEVGPVVDRGDRLTERGRAVLRAGSVQVVIRGSHSDDGRREPVFQRFDVRPAAPGGRGVTGRALDRGRQRAEGAVPPGGRHGAAPRSGGGLTGWLRPRGLPRPSRPTRTGARHPERGDAPGQGVLREGYRGTSENG